LCNIPSSNLNGDSSSDSVIDFVKPVTF
jgi:hypothetical protein